MARPLHGPQGLDHGPAGEPHPRFSGGQPASSHVPGMAAAEVVVPAPVAAVWGTGAAAVERWAAGLRADLARLTAHLRQLQAEADAAERHLVGADAVEGPARGEDLLGLVDEMLAAARARVDAVCSRLGP